MEAHEILGVSQYASEDQIRAAYKTLAMKWHPDRQLANSEEATTKFAEINKANRTMLRNLRRARRAAQAGQATTTSSDAGSAPPSPQSTTTTLSESSTCSSAFHSEASSEGRGSSEFPSSSSATSNPFSSPRSSSSDISQTRGLDKSPESACPPAAESSGSHTSSKSFLFPSSTEPLRSKLRKTSKSTSPDLGIDTWEDTQPLLHGLGRVVKTLRPGRVALHGTGTEVPRKWTHTLTMSLEEIYQGKTFHFRVVRYTRSGKKIITPIDVRVPAGSRGGTEVIVQGAGNECKDGSWQELSFMVKEAKHNKFKRIHNDLLLEVRLPWVESLNSQEGQVYLHGIDEKDYLFKVDYHATRLLSGTAVVSGAGMPCRDGGGRGRIIVRWQIAPPSSSWGTIKNALRFGSRN